jgi:hypothetical protein
MKFYARHRDSAEFLAVCAARHWPTDTSRFDQGGDHIVFRFTVGDVMGEALFSVVSGRFFGSVVRPCCQAEDFNSDEEYDGEEWFDALLDACLVGEVVA